MEPCLRPLAFRPGSIWLNRSDCNMPPSWSDL